VPPGLLQQESELPVHRDQRSAQGGGAEAGLAFALEVLIAEGVRVKRVRVASTLTRLTWIVSYGQTRDQRQHSLHVGGVGWDAHRRAHRAYGFGSATRLHPPRELAHAPSRTRRLLDAPRRPIGDEAERRLRGARIAE